MIHFEQLRDRNILIITPEGLLEKSDFERFTKEIETFIASKGKLTGLMIDAQSFPGWRTFGAFTSHLRFIGDHHRQIERIAVVATSGFLKIMPHFAGLFVHPKIRHFEPENRHAAIAWLESGQ